MDSLFTFLTGALAYSALSNWPGIILILAAMAGLIVLMWKHFKNGKEGYRFSFRYVLDIWALLIITACIAAGIWMFVRDEVRPAEQPKTFWECITK